MSFFEIPPPIPEPPRRPEPPQPAWAGPPSGVLPGVSTQRVVVFKTDRAFLMVDRLNAYPNGIEFTLNLRLRDPVDGRYELPWELHRRPGPLPDDFLRLGVLLSDGTKWTNLEERPWRHNEPPEPPVVMTRGGGGGGESYRMRYWMWPLPPEGPLTIVAEWPAYDIMETRADLDATELRARAAEAERVWPDQPA